MHTIPVTPEVVNADFPRICSTNAMRPCLDGFNFVHHINSATGDANAALVVCHILMYQSNCYEQWISIDEKDILFHLWMPLPRFNTAINLLTEIGVLEVKTIEAPPHREYMRVKMDALDTLLKQAEPGYMPGQRLPDDEWKWLKKRVLHRNDCRCHYCYCTDKVMHVDHKVPVSKGGDNSFHNLVAACEDCNLRKGVRDYAEFVAEAMKSVF